MPGCILHATGPKFDVDAFLADSPLKPYRVFHRGERRRKGKRWGLSGFGVEASTAFGDLQKQCRRASAFLRKFQADLVRLRGFPGVSDVWLDFGYLRRDVAVQADWLPSDLLRLIGALGFDVCLTLYPNERQMKEILADEPAD